MAKISQARKALNKKKPGPSEAARNSNAAKGVGESERTALDAGVDVDSIDAAFAVPGKDAEAAVEPAKTARPAKKAASRATN